MARHRRRRRRGAVTLGVCLVVAAAGVGLAVRAARHASIGRPSAHGSHGVHSTRSPVARPTPAPVRSATGSSNPAEPSATASATNTVADKRLAGLVAAASATATSVAALDVTTGRGVDDGAAAGMTTASIAKVQLLETLLLQDQRAGKALTGAETHTVTAMIENSSNDAANETYYDIGDRAKIVGLEPALGLSTEVTVPGAGVLWGLTTTSASQELVLLGDLVDKTSPLDTADRTFTLSLMRDVEADQRWGVPAAATDDPDPAVKNGWLSVATDGDLWAVNSLGIIRAGSHTVLVAVMTQHDQSFDSGIARVEALAKAAVAAVAT